MTDKIDEQNSNTDNLNTSSPNNTELYSSLATMWSGAIGAQHSLLAAYITAHSFLIAALVLLSISISPSNSLVLIMGVLLVSVVGAILSLQMALAWGRFIARVSLFEWHLQIVEKTFNKNSSKVFTDWEIIKDNPQNDLIDPTDNSNNFYANWSVKHHKKWWATRAKMIPILVGTVYLLFFIFGAVKIDSTFNKKITKDETPIELKKAKEVSIEDESKELSKPLPKEKPIK